jgi:DNA-binding beta-propeller fold protein YncE
MKMIYLVTLVLIIYMPSSCSVPDNSLNGPTNAVIGPGDLLYVSDGYYNARVAVFNRSGDYLDSFGYPGFGRGEFHTPHDIAVSSEGLLYIADRGNRRIQVLTHEGIYVREIQVPAVGHPFSVKTASGNRLFIADGGTQSELKSGGIFEYLNDGTFLQSIGSFGNQAGEFNDLHMISVDSSLNIFSAELGVPRLQKFTRASCGSDVCVYNAETTWPAENTKQRIENALAVSADNLGNLYASSYGSQGRVLKISVTTGELLAEYTHPGLVRPHGLSSDNQNNIWITDNETNRIFFLSNNGQLQQVIGD